MVFGQYLNTHRIFKRLAQALIRLRICAGLSEPLLSHIPHCRKFHVAARVIAFLHFPLWPQTCLYNIKIAAFFNINWMSQNKVKSATNF